MAADPQEALAWERIQCGETHCIALRDGVAHSWPLTRAGNRFGQLGHGAAAKDVDLETAAPAPIRCAGLPRIVEVAAGGRKDGGHTALVGEDGSVWMCGCDRWQQLGLSGAGGPAGNAAGYTWRDGKIWQPSPQRVAALSRFNIANVALGGDHSIALDSNGRDVFSWGRGEAGQLADGKPFVRAPGRAAQVCAPAGQRVRAIAALHDCTGVALQAEGGGGGGAEAAPVTLALAGRCAQVRAQIAASLGLPAEAGAAANDGRRRDDG